VHDDRRQPNPDRLNGALKAAAAVELGRSGLRSERERTFGRLLQADFIAHHHVRHVAGAAEVAGQPFSGRPLALTDRAAALEQRKLRHVPSPGQLARPLLLELGDLFQGKRFRRVRSTMRRAARVRFLAMSTPRASPRR
jgi:hypothetical protein